MNYESQGMAAANGLLVKASGLRRRGGGLPLASAAVIETAAARLIDLFVAAHLGVVTPPTRQRGRAPSVRTV